MKKCFKCGLNQPLSQFYKHPRMLDGYLNKCKKCTRTDSENNRQRKIKDDTWIESEKKRARDKWRRLYKGGKIKTPKNGKTGDPSKVRARGASKKLISPYKGLEKHHWSYSKQDSKDIMWISKKDHMKAHRFLVYDKNLLKFRTLDEVLLGNKIDHYLYIIKRINLEDD